MKKLLLVAALSSLTAGAFAQNTTIYGRFNVSVERMKSAGVTSTELRNNSSRIGFKGTEDLGGGLKAGFQLEHGFNVDTGAATQGTAIWARQSEVNLGGSFGTIRLGNFASEAYFATADYISMHNHDTGTSSDALYAYAGKNGNKIAYRLPDMNGLTVEGAMSLKESGTDNSFDLAANYAMGALELGAGFEKNGSAKQFAVRANYAMGPFVLGGYVQRDTDVYASGSRSTFRLVGMYTMGTSELHLNVGRAGDYSNVANSDATQFTLGYNHNLSKRTKVYTYYTKVSDNGGVYGGDFNSFALGMRHNF